MQSQIPSTPKEALKAINILFYAMVTGVFFFACIIYFLNSSKEPVITNKETIQTLLIVVLLVATFIITLAERTYKKRILAVKGMPLPLMKKLEACRAALIVYWAACEGIGIFALIIYFLTGSKLFLAVTLLAILGMLLRRPQKSRIFNDLHLSSEEQMELN